MGTKADLVRELVDGKTNAKTGTTLERNLGMPIGNTNEPTRGLIADCILKAKYPIGSCNHGYFLINSDVELQEAVSSLQSRIIGIQKRINALQDGWKRRKSSRAAGQNWPK